MFRALASLTVSVLILSAGTASACRATQNFSSQADNPVTPVVEKEKPSSGDLKVLAEGSHSSIAHPFVAVVRDAETYSALRKLEANLPNLDAESFKSDLVVAAFLGERNTGGYSVEITRVEDGRIYVEERVPTKGVMVPQVITSPFKIVSVSATGASPLRLSLVSAWSQEMRPCRVTSGNFTMSGGFAGTTKRFGLEGQVWVIRQNNLVTLAFEVFSHELTENRSLVGFETGVIKSKGEIAIPKMTADSLIDSPNSGLKATGAFSDADNKLLLNFLSLPSMIADGYIGWGSIEAKTVVSQPKP